MRHIVLSLLLAVTLCTASGCSASAPDAAPNLAHDSSDTTSTYVPLVPDNQQSRIEEEVVHELQSNHYNKIKLDKDFSKKLFKAYLDDLDPTHSIFLAGDVEHMRDAYAGKMSQQLKDGDLSAAFAIFNTFQKRRLQIDQWVLARIKKGLGSLDLHNKEFLRIDRRESPWPDDEAAREKLWLKQLENQVIDLKLNDIDSSEILKRLTQRYTNRLKRLKQVEPSDVFSMYMDAYTHCYDPHTDYFSPKRYENFSIDMNLQLQGIGAELRYKNGYAEIVRLIAGGPAAKSGQLKPTDRIIAVGQGEHGDFTDVIGMRLDRTVQLIRGKAGSTIRLQVTSGDSSQTHTVTLTRAKIKLKDQAASSHVIDVKRGGKTYKIGVVTLPSFYNGTTRDVEKQLRELEKDGVKGVILDLRNNGGGALDEAVQLIGAFMPSAPVVQIKDADGNIQVLGFHNHNPVYSGPLAVMTNRLSASASEIVTGALKDYGRAIIVGSRTFGKGTVQTLLPLSSGQLKLTEAKFYRVTGKSTQDRGVKPDITFPSAIDPKKIGESALPNALPYDTIPPTSYPSSDLISHLLPTLKLKHIKRASEDPDFQYLVKRIKLTREEGAKKMVSLDIKTRRAQQKGLEDKILHLANVDRQADGKKPYPDYQAFQDAQDDKASAKTADNSSPTSESLPVQSADSDDEKPDAYQIETANILLDLIALSQHQSALLRKAA